MIYVFISLLAVAAYFVSRKRHAEIVSLIDALDKDDEVGVYEITDKKSSNMWRD